MALESRGVTAAIEFVGGLNRRKTTALVRSINRTARDQRTAAARMIGEQIAFPSSYLRGGDGRRTRLFVSDKARPGHLRAAITARSRPTSLAQFVRSAARPGAPVNVEVRPGRSRQLRRAFLIRLRRGTELTDTRFNLGLAIRLRPGERLSNKIRQVQISRGLYLLYGPSVQQVFLDNSLQGVARDLERPTAIKLEREFLRQLGL